MRVSELRYVKYLEDDLAYGLVCIIMAVGQLDDPQAPQPCHVQY